MALLTHPCWEAITPVLRELLRFTGHQDFCERFYLAGGTALALRIGHRRSVDLDFFSSDDTVTGATRQEIIRAFTPLGGQALENTEGNLLLEVRSVHVGFFGYSYPLLAPTNSVEGVALAGILDIGLMKLDALISRAGRKDFYDLYWIAREIPLDVLLARGPEKYPYARDFELLAVESLVFFDNADRDLAPVLLADVPWEDVKRFFRAEARRLGERWWPETGQHLRKSNKPPRPARR